MSKGFSYKDFFIKYGLLMAIVSVTVGILVYFSIISNNSWTKNLGTSLQKVLNDNSSEQNEWVLNENIYINNPFAYNASCYSVTNVSEKKDYIAIIVRINSFYGPLPAVFIMDEENNVDFIGYSSLNGRIKEKINKANDNRIRYWKNKIPQVLKDIER
jgi:hypothetical protein